MEVVETLHCFHVAVVAVLVVREKYNLPVCMTGWLSDCLTFPLPFRSFLMSFLSMFTYFLKTVSMGAEHFLYLNNNRI